MLLFHNALTQAALFSSLLSDRKKVEYFIGFPQNLIRFCGGVTERRDGVAAKTQAGKIYANADKNLWKMKHKMEIYPIKESRKLEYIRMQFFLQRSQISFKKYSRDLS